MDTTDARIPILHLPGCRKLTAEECEQKAQEIEKLLPNYYDGPDKRFLQRELRAWRRLAQERF